MRLAYLTSQFPFAYLGETFFGPELNVLTDLCERVHVIPARPELRTTAFGQLRTVDVRISPVEMGTLLSALTEAVCHPVRAVAAFGRLAFPRYGFDAKIKNIGLFPKALAVARYVRKERVEHIHANWLTTPGTIAYVASMMTGIPWSCTAHAHDIFSDNLLKEKARSARFIRVIAERNRRHLARVTGVAADQLHLVHVGVDVPPQAAPLPLDRPLQIVCAARLDPIKGHEDLLRALAILRDRGVAFHCDIAGNGPLEDHLASIVAQLKLQGFVNLRGLVEHRFLLDELRNGKYDVLALPSIELELVGKHSHEGIPVALIEAMAVGVPCVATDTGCIPELIDEHTGVLVNQRDPNALADALLRLARDRTLRRSLGEAARERINNEFNVKTTTRTLYELIRADMERNESSGLADSSYISPTTNIPVALRSELLKGNVGNGNHTGPETLGYTTSDVR